MNQRQLISTALEYYTYRELSDMLNVTEITVKNWQQGIQEMRYSKGKVVEELVQMIEK